MKKITMWLAVMVLCLGCETAGERFERQMKERPVIHINLEFRKGQVVDLKIGGMGQVISVDSKSRKPYYIRIRTDNGPMDIWMNEFELRLAQWEPS